MEIKIRSERGRMPSYETEGSAGMDLQASLDAPVVINPGERALIPTGLFIELPPGYEAQIRARSGLAIKKGIGLVNGVGTIDSDYRGEIQVGLCNLGNQPYTIRPEERIAQLVVTPVCLLPIEEVEVLDETGRGEGGFGSTGTH